jgi:hypothetical protein
MLSLSVLVLATIEIPAKAAVNSQSIRIASVAPPPGLLPTGVGLAALLALRKQKKNSL